MKTCRICLGHSDLTSIFGTDEAIAENIMLFASVLVAIIHVTEGDTLPQFICKLCKIELDICITFKDKCESSYQVLRNVEQDLKSDTEVIVIECEESQLKSDVSQSDIGILETTLVDSEQCKLSLPFLNFDTEHVKEELKYTCNICNSHFVYKNKFVQHLKSEHDVVVNVTKLKQCDICGKRFQYNVQLSRHMVMHSGIKQFKCNQCDKFFSSKGGLNKHISKHNSVRKFPCSICNKIFIHQSNLRQHLKVHFDEKRYRCHICSKGFKARRTLMLHIKIHNNERDFPCDKCDKAFTNKFDLLRHGKLHTVELESDKNVPGNPRQCEVCGKLCQSLSDLQKHIRVHTGETPFVCIYCKKAFKSSSALNCHTRIHRKRLSQINDSLEYSALKIHKKMSNSMLPYRKEVLQQLLIAICLSNQKTNHMCVGSVAKALSNHLTCIHMKQYIPLLNPTVATSVHDHSVEGEICFVTRKNVQDMKPFKVVIPIWIIKKETNMIL
ncbi:hypothetical protein NQ318_008780 [Aromia moschata]|uniref:Uncharacterized protein n=1 Tax=Aromia moschata TaxID=1265417 RepID=A0AAV8ZA51_9CUCU|nr:hypothetical protein NQ318_008780 [Aromia moschata]